MGLGVQERGEELSVVTWIPENSSGRAMGVPLGCVSVCSIVWGWEEQEIHTQTSAWSCYPHQDKNWWGNRRKNREKCGQMRPFPGEEEYVEVAEGGDEFWTRLCQTFSPFLWVCGFAGRG